MKKPWPSDAIMVIASLRGKENASKMEAVVFTHCRDCDTELAADSFTIRRANEISGQTGERPVKFFCVSCATQYNHATIDYLEDHR